VVDAGEVAADGMLGHAAVEEGLVLELHPRHLEQAGGEVASAGQPGEPARLLVLADVAGLEARGRVHRQQPARDVAERAENAAHGQRDALSGPGGGRPQGGEQTSQLIAVVPLLPLDAENATAFGGVGQRLPVPAVGEGGGALAGVRTLEQPDQSFTGATVGQGTLLPVWIDRNISLYRNY